MIEPILRFKLTCDICGMTKEIEGPSQTVALADVLKAGEWTVRFRGKEKKPVLHCPLHKS